MSVGSSFPDVEARVAWICSVVRPSCLPDGTRPAVLRCDRPVLGEVHGTKGGTHLDDSGSDGMIPKECCELQLASEAVGNSDRLFVDRTCGCVNLNVVQFKEQQCSDSP